MTLFRVKKAFINCILIYRFVLSLVTKERFFINLKVDKPIS